MQAQLFLLGSSTNHILPSDPFNYPWMRNTLQFSSKIASCEIAAKVNANEVVGEMNMLFDVYLLY